MINKDCFRSYDIRGIYKDGEITNELANLLGKAFGSIADGKVIVGHDARFSSNALNTNLIMGLLSTGVEVIDIGLVTTPMLYYAREYFNTSYAIMITASHCTKEHNGFKMCDEDGAMYGDKITMLYNKILEGNFKTGVGRIESYDITFDYKMLMDKKIRLGNRKLKAVVDCGNGTTAIINPSIVENWGVEVIPLYCDSDPNFPNHTPDPAVEGNMYDLVKTDMFMLIIWKDLVNKCKNKTASFDVKCSKALKEGLEKLGLKTSFNRTGHSYLKKAIKENNYDFAGEFSGHVCFNDDFYGYDDALYAAGRLLKILSNTNDNVSDFFKDTPVYVTSEESYITVGEENKDRIVNKVLEYAQNKNLEIITVDGVRIEYPDGFALVRKSNTSPCLTVRFEGSTKEQMEKYRKEIIDIINSEIN